MELCLNALRVYFYNPENSRGYYSIRGIIPEDWEDDNIGSGAAIPGNYFCLCPTGGSRVVFLF
jgi:hypothetical protein